MSRIPTHTVDDAPQACRRLLENVIQFSPTGQPLNLHAQMAHSPAVLAAYTSLRAATAEHGTVGPQLPAALMLTAASAVGNDYAVAITSRLAAPRGVDRRADCGTARGNRDRRRQGGRDRRPGPGGDRQLREGERHHVEQRSGRRLERRAADGGVRLSRA